MPEILLQSKRVADWLESCGESTEEHQRKPLFPSPLPPATLHACLKRPNMDDETPRAKRQANGVGTPSASNKGESYAAIVDDHRTPSLRTSTTTSRSSSPSKRQREAEIEFSKPAFDFHNRSDSKCWKEQNARQVPLMTELLESINAHDTKQRVSSKMRSKLVKILKEMEKCKDRGATEEAWSDAVVHPVLRLARKLLQDEESVDIINVKSIDVWPAELLPTNTQSLPMGKKRVDYTIGLEIAERDGIKAFLGTAEHHTLTQSNHKMLRDRALCAHLEIKVERSLDDGRFQLSTWCAAGFQKQENLWLQRHRHVQQPTIPILAPLPLALERNERAVMGGGNGLQEREDSCVG